MNGPPVPHPLRSNTASYRACIGSLTGPQIAEARWTVQMLQDETQMLQGVSTLGRASHRGLNLPSGPAQRCLPHNYVLCPGSPPRGTLDPRESLHDVYGTPLPCACLPPAPLTAQGTLSRADRTLKCQNALLPYMCRHHTPHRVTHTHNNPRLITHVTRKHTKQELLKVLHIHASKSETGLDRTRAPWPSRPPRGGGCVARTAWRGRRCARAQSPPGPRP